MKLKYLITVLIIIILGAFVFFALKSRSSLLKVQTEYVKNSITPADTTPTNITKATTPDTIVVAPIRVGAVTWHTKNLIGKEVKIVGFVLKKEKGYILFSDEATGPITKGDMPVIGAGVDTMLLKQKYVLQGKFLYQGLTASNSNQYHLELSQAPTAIN